MATREEAIAELKSRRGIPAAAPANAVDAPQEPSFLDELGRAGLRTVRMGASGLATLGDLVNAPIDAALSATGTNFRFGSPSQAIKQSIDAETKGTPYSTAPQNALERITDTAGEFVASAGPVAAISKVAPALNKLNPSTLKELASFATAGAGSQIAAEVAPNSELARFGGMLAGALVPGAATGIGAGVRNFATKPKTAIDPGTAAAVKIMRDEGKTPAEILAAVQNSADSTTQGLPRTVFEESGGPAGIGVQQSLTEGRSPATAQGATVLTDFNKGRTESNIPAVMKDTFQQNVSTTSPVTAANNAIQAAGDIISQKSKDLTASVAPKYAGVMAKQLPPSWVKNLYDNNPSFASRFNAMKSDPDFQQLVMDAERDHGVKLTENSVGYLDTAKKYLDSAYQNSLDDFGKPTAQSKAIQSARTALVNKLDTAVPKYAEARKAYGEGSIPVTQLKDSLLGNIAKATDEKQVFNTVFNDLPEKIGTAREMFHSAGKGQQWNDLVSAWISRQDDLSTGSAQSLINKLAKNDDVINRMRQAIGPKDYASYKLLIDNLQKIAKTQPGNSQTAGKLQAQQYLEPANSALADQVNTKGATMRALDYLTSKITKGMDERAVKAAQEKNYALAKAITSPDVGQYKMALKGLDAKGRLAATASWLDRRLPIASVASPTEQAIAKPAIPQNTASNDTDLRQKAIAELKRRRSAGVAPDITKAEGSRAGVPDDIAKAEGLRHAVYYDTTGHKTIGYGFNMDSGIANRVWKAAGMQKDFDAVYDGKEKITDAEANALGRVSVEIARSDAADVYPDFPKLSESRQAALTNLSYNLGKGSLSNLDSFNTAVNNGQWQRAVYALLTSKYARNDPNRMRNIARGLLRGS